MIETTTELIIGIAFGLVIGIGPAIAVGILGAVFSDRGSSLPLPASVALGVAMATLNGYFVGVLEPGLVRTQLPRLATGTLVVAILTVSAASQGERVASELPFGAGRPTQRNRSLAAAAIDSVDAMGQVTVRTTGRIRDIDGYQSLSPDVRRALEADAWRFPADLPLSALEMRLETRLRTEYELAAVAVSIDGRARATVAAAPESGDTATAVPDGWRAVSISALLPTGLRPGDDVAVHVRGASVTATVLSASQRDQSGHGQAAPSLSDDLPVSGPATDSGAGFSEGGTIGNGSRPAIGATNAAPRPTAETVGGDGHVTVAVPSADADSLLAAERARIAVPASGLDADRQALSRLERADYSVRRVSFGTVREHVDTGDGATDETIRVLAASRPNDDGDGTGSTSIDPVAERETWCLDPDVATLDDRDDVFVVGERIELQRRIDDEREPTPRSTVIPVLEGES
ncbi:hypothetical protein CP556_13735 [Natrinema sp. CBA1119]|uniref:hypothetical protein n=1 Tax=Natrinema sp. CBA1119 TaxID=1608465 RepID=UPI000BF50B78|nr:hypothetical protein [Natrinema sp. CBA1119]PGF17072.1 hypothetical protein CP556_13735 [Natrinema sp. CBA1119]